MVDQQTKQIIADRNYRRKLWKKLQRKRDIARLSRDAQPSAPALVIRLRCPECGAEFEIPLNGPASTCPCGSKKFARVVEVGPPTPTPTNSGWSRLIKKLRRWWFAIPSADSVQPQAPEASNDHE